MYEPSTEMLILQESNNQTYTNIMNEIIYKYNEYNFTREKEPNLIIYKYNE